jgi:hypothetical protein
LAQVCPARACKCAPSKPALLERYCRGLDGSFQSQAGPEHPSLFPSFFHACNTARQNRVGWYDGRNAMSADDGVRIATQRPLQASVVAKCSSLSAAWRPRSAGALAICRLEESRSPELVVVSFPVFSRGLLIRCVQACRLLVFDSVFC